jgi:RNA polymerase sigma-70 factor (ECF subfamily)
MDLESAIERLAPELLRFCTGLTRDRAEGEEVAQEALTALVRYWRQHGPPDSPAAFAYTVARRQALRWQRRLRRFLPVEALDERRDPSPSAETQSIQSQRLRETLAVLGQLGRRDQEAILLAVDPELGVEEAAGILGIAPSAFKMRVHRARQRLSSLLEKRHGPRKAEGENVHAGS